MFLDEMCYKSQTKATLVEAMLGYSCNMQGLHITGHSSPMPAEERSAKVYD